MDPIDDTQRGLYEKYRVERFIDPEGRHADCFYFVLDLDHDLHARAALRTYADSVRRSHPLLAADLDVRLAGYGEPLPPPAPAVIELNPAVDPGSIRLQVGRRTLGLDEIERIVVQHVTDEEELKDIAEGRLEVDGATHQQLVIRNEHHLWRLFEEPDSALSEGAMAALLGVDRLTLRGMHLDYLEREGSAAAALQRAAIARFDASTQVEMRKRFAHLYEGRES